MYFRLVKEKFAGPVRFRVGAIAVDVGGNMKRVKPCLPIFNPPKGMGKIAPAGPDRLDFRASQDDAGFDRFQDGIVMTGPAVVNFDCFQGASPRRPEGAFRKTSWRGSYEPAWQGPRWPRRQ